jgi:hypothetical protein
MVKFTGKCEDIPNIDILISLNIQLDINKNCKNLRHFQNLRYIYIRQTKTPEQQKTYINLRGMKNLERVHIYGDHMDVVADLDGKQITRNPIEQEL